MAKEVYNTKIKPNLKKIAKWKLEGYTDREICKMIGITKSTFYKYMNDETRPGIKEAKEEAVRAAQEYKEKIVTEAKKSLMELVKEKHYQAIQYALNNFGGFMAEKDKQMIELRKQEIEQQKKADEQKPQTQTKRDVFRRAILEIEEEESNGQ